MGEYVSSSGCSGIRMHLRVSGSPINCCFTGDDHQVAIFDATNTTLERRQYLIDKFHNKVQYMFIESICNDEETLRKNVELKLKYSPDYENMGSDEVCLAAVRCMLLYCSSCVACVSEARVTCAYHSALVGGLSDAVQCVQICTVITSTYP
jgi:hypothetical protein